MNGSKKMVYRVSVCFILLCSSAYLYAEELIEKEQQIRTPSMDFLEFLGEWETEQGEWVDPETMQDEELGQIIETTIEMKNVY